MQRVSFFFFCNIFASSAGDMSTFSTVPPALVQIFGYLARMHGLGKAVSFPSATDIQPGAEGAPKRLTTNNSCQAESRQGCS